MKNTRKKGTVQFFFYPTKKYGWCGICKEFGIVHYDKNLKKLAKDVLEMAQDHLEFVQKNKLPDHNLNRNVSFIHHLNFSFFILRKSVSKGLLVNLIQPYNHPKDLSFSV